MTNVFLRLMVPKQHMTVINRHVKKWVFCSRILSIINQMKFLTFFNIFLITFYKTCNFLTFIYNYILKNL